ncbi:MAG: class I SAM-dependent methyltransferase, partial [Chlamydiota bacterium]|nr:class I SAM-dependent methyltransferase [Chlamydiota bacterium]
MLSDVYIREGDPFAFFESIYQEAKTDPGQIPWAHMEINPDFSEWLRQNPIQGSGQNALVIGCGLGDDAEALSQCGFEVTAFDFSPTAIGWAKSRFPETKVHYQVADLLDPPEDWAQRYDWVLEIHTIQALPIHIRQEVMACIAIFIKPGGHLLVFCRARAETSIPDGPPWPVCKKEMDYFKEF